jgi:hypothetical protein
MVFPSAPRIRSPIEVRARNSQLASTGEIEYAHRAGDPADAQHGENHHGEGQNVEGALDIGFHRSFRLPELFIAQARPMPRQSPRRAALTGDSMRQLLLR